MSSITNRWVFITFTLWLSEAYRYWTGSDSGDWRGYLILWGTLGLISGVAVLVNVILSRLAMSSWPSLRSARLITKALIALGVIASLLVITWSAQRGLEWSSARFRRPLYRGLFTGLIASLSALLCFISLPSLLRLPLSLQRGGERGASPSRWTLASRVVWGGLGFIACLYIPRLISTLFDSLSTVDLRPPALILLGVWAGLVSAPLRRGDAQLGSRAERSSLSGPITLGALIALTLGLYLGEISSPSSAALIKRDSALAGHALTLTQTLTDRDGDGVSGRWGGGDCDDSDSKRHPDAVESAHTHQHKTKRRDKRRDKRREEREVDLNCNHYLSPRGSHQWPPNTQRANHLHKAQRALTGPPEEALRVSRAPKNLILLTIDALRYDAYLKHMPKTRAFAQRSVDFSAAYSAGAATYWSIPALLGSRPPSYFEMGRDQTPKPSERLLTESLRERGFHTALFANVTIFFVRGLSQGAITKNYETSRYTVHGAKPGAAHMTNGIIRHIDTWRAGRLKPKRDRLFVWGHYYDPHDPYFEVSGFPASSPEPQDRYAAIVRSVDAELGRLFRALEKRNMLKDTAVVLTSDHGDEFGEHGHRFHGKTLYDEMVHVPLIIYSPSYPAQEVSEVISHLDVAPTLLSHLGLPAESRFLGGDWDGALRRGRAIQGREAFFEVLPDSNYGIHLVGMRRAQEKWIYHAQSGALERYHLDRDPRERLNLHLSAPSATQGEPALQRYYEAHLRALARGKSGARYPRRARR